MYIAREKKEHSFSLKYKINRLKMLCLKNDV